MELGMHFALTDEVAERLLAARGDDERVTDLVDDIEEEELSAFFCEADKAWDPIHCAIAPGVVERTDETWPAHGVILGDEDLNTDIDDQLISYLAPARVGEVAEYLSTLTQAEFERQYDEMPVDDRNPEFGPDERGYAWAYLTDINEFFQRAAAERLHVVFSVRF